MHRSRLLLHQLMVLQATSGNCDFVELIYWPYSSVAIYTYVTL